MKNGDLNLSTLNSEPKNGGVSLMAFKKWLIARVENTKLKIRINFYKHKSTIYIGRRIKYGDDCDNDDDNCSLVHIECKCIYRLPYFPISESIRIY